MAIEINFSDDDLKSWRQYEKVRKGGGWNMFDPKARAATKLDSETYSFVMRHYSELKSAVDRKAAIKKQMPNTSPSTAQWSARMRRFLRGRKHHEAAKELGVGLETFRTWLYAKSKPCAFTQAAAIRRIKELEFEVPEN